MTEAKAVLSAAGALMLACASQGADAQMPGDRSTAPAATVESGTGAAPIAATPTPASSATAAAAATAGIQDIVVTARRREESAQRTPISVAAVSSIALERANITRPTALSRVVAGLITTPTVSYGGGSTAFIRGIGAQETALFSDPPVGEYRDGIYLGHSTVAGDVELLNLARVEVLRGPQGTLFGRNTTGGAINLVTRDPYDTFGASQKLRYGRYNEFITATSIDSGKLGASGLSATLTYAHRQRNGYVNDPTARGSRDPGAQNSETVFAKVKGQWGDLRADYAFDYYDARITLPYFQLVATSPNVGAYLGASPGLGGTTFPVSGGGRVGRANLIDTDRVHIKNWGHALTLAYRPSTKINLKSITAYRRYRASLPYNLSADGVVGFTTTSPAVPVPITLYSSVPRVQRTRQFTQELQAFGDLGRLSYTVGAFYFHESGLESNQTNSTFVLSPTLGRQSVSRSTFRIRNSSKAVYGQLSYEPPILDGRLELTGGVRYNIDKRRLEQFAPVIRTGRRTFKNTSYALSAKMQWTPTIMTFARVSTAIRSGGFNTRTAANSPAFNFKPEKALSYEVGLKSQFLDNKVRLNAGLFYTKYRDLQVTQVLGVAANGQLTGSILNANANFRGGEVELTVVPARGLTLTANAGYVDPKYKQIFFLDPATGVPRNYADQAHFPYLPKVNMNLGIAYEAEKMTIGQPIFSLDYSFVSRRYFTPIEITGNNPLGRAIVSRRYGTFNGRISLAEVPVGNVEGEVSLWMDNITNKHYRVAGVDYGSLGFAGDVYGVPRTFGVDLKLKF